jgi:hypothetical protein
MAYTRRLWRYAGTAFCCCGMAALLAPFFGVPSLPGNEASYSVLTCMGYVLLVLWALLSWAINYRRISRMIMSLAATGLTAFTTPGAVRTMVRVVSVPEDTIAIVLHAMTLMIFALPLVVLFREVWREKRSANVRDRWGLYCARCGYCLVGNVSGRCPECGAALPADVAEHVKRLKRRP